MSLDYKLTDIENYEETCLIVADRDDFFRGIKIGDKVLNPLTESLIFLTLSVRAGWGITEENVEEFAARVDLWQKINGAMLRKKDEGSDEWVDRPVTRADIDAHLGLWTNAGLQDRSDWLDGVFHHAYPQAPLGNVVDDESEDEDCE